MFHQIWEFTRYLLLNMNSDSLVVTVAVVQLLSLSDSMWPYGLQHSRLLCPPLYPGVCSNLWPLSRWCYQSSHLLSNPSSFCLQSFPAAVFYNESALCIRQPKDWSFSFSLSNDYSVLIFFRIDWFDLLAVQGTLKSLL